MRYLLDTCVISELVSKQPNETVTAWIDSVEEERIFLSAVTVGEIQRGIERLPDFKRKRELVAWLAEDLLIRFHGRILALDANVFLTWGSMVAGLEHRGRTLPAFDSLIAAVALTHGLELVTRNDKDFMETGVSLLNPWNSECD